MRDRVRLALAVVSCTVWARVGAASPFAYVSNFHSATVSVIDTATNNVVGTVPGSFPRGVAVSPTGTRVYVSNVSNSANSYVAVIDAFTNTIVTTVPVGPFPTAWYPDGIAVSPDGSKVYVATGCCTMTVIDTATNTVSATVPLTVPDSGFGLEDLAVNPAGTRVYITEPVSQIVSVVDTTTTPPTEIATVSGAGGRNLAINPAGTLVYVSDESNDAIQVIDAATNTLSTPIPTGCYPGGFFVTGPFGLALNSTATRLYTTCGSNLKVIDTATNLVIDTIVLGGLPSGIRITPDDQRAYVTDHSSNAVIAVDLATDTIVASVPVGDTPVGEGNFIGPQFVCGNNIREPGEGCDDGNTVGGDTCPANCLLPHDSVVLANKPLTVTIPKRGGAVSRQVKVKVINADVSPVPETPGHAIQLSAQSDCGWVAPFPPDFGGGQSSAVVPGGTSKTASVTVWIYGSSNFNHKAPSRCTVTFEASAVGTGMGIFDPTPANNTATVEVSAVDLGRAEGTTPHETVLKSLSPLTVKISSSATTKSVKAHPHVVNADYLPVPENAVSHVVSVAVTASDCPTATLGAVGFGIHADSSVGVQGGRTATGSLPVSVDSTQFSTASALSPGRCTAVLTASGPPGDTDATNNSSRLLIDVIQK